MKLLDCRKQMCPMPIIKIAETMDEVENGEKFQVIATDPGIKEDIKAWTESTGHLLLSFEDDPEGGYVFVLQKKAG